MHQPAILSFKPKGHATTDAIRADPLTLRAARHIERRFLLLLLPAFALACVVANLVSFELGTSTWFEHYVLPPSGAIFLGLWCWLRRLRPSRIGPVRTLTLIIGPGIVLLRVMQMLIATAVWGHEAGNYAPLVPWIVLACGLFVFYLPSPWSWVASTSYCGVVLLAAALFLAFNGQPLPTYIYDDMLPNYFIALPSTLLMMAAFSRMRSEYGRARARAEDLEDLALRDQLTGLHNRRAFNTSLRRVQARQLRSRRPASVVVVDLDHFKRVNDDLGHQVGDSVLVGVAEVMRHTLRGSDEIFRFGGEEFVLLLEETPLDVAREVAERVRRAIESAQLLGDRPVTASFGVTELTPLELFDTFYPRADRALYKAKQRGRNQVCTESPFAEVSLVA